MLVYLISLPIWNGVLPAYVFWHFDDFSCGQTRKIREAITEIKTGNLICRISLEERDPVEEFGLL